MRTNYSCIQPAILILSLGLSLLLITGCNLFCDDDRPLRIHGYLTRYNFFPDSTTSFLFEVQVNWPDGGGPCPGRTVTDAEIHARGATVIFNGEQVFYNPMTGSHRDSLNVSLEPGEGFTIIAEVPEGQTTVISGLFPRLDLNGFPTTGIVHAGDTLTLNWERGNTTPWFYFGFSVHKDSTYRSYLRDLEITHPDSNSLHWIIPDTLAGEHLYFEVYFSGYCDVSSSGDLYDPDIKFIHFYESWIDILP